MGPGQVIEFTLIPINCCIKRALLIPLLLWACCCGNESRETLSGKHPYLVAS